MVENNGKRLPRKKPKKKSNNMLVIPALLLLALGFALSGCTTLSPTAQKIHDADPQMVTNCKFMGDVQGSSEWGLPGSIAKSNARNEALEKAAQIGATHVLWVQFTVPPNPSYYGRAYKCD